MWDDIWRRLLMDRSHLLLMLLLSGLFALRVAGQLVQAVHEVPYLPSFEAWQGSGIPYPVLLGFQGGILAVLIVVLWRVNTNAFTPRPWKHQACFALGGVYFVAMTFRLVAGLTFPTEYTWFAKSVPALFHIILASLILVFGHYLLMLGNRRANKSA